MKQIVVLVGMLAVLVPAAPAALADAPAPKIAVIVMENKPYTKIVGSSSAPYMNALIQQGKLFTDYHAQISGSPRDYRAMTAGVTAPVSPLPSNVFKTLDQRSIPWKEYEESMAGNCGVKTTATVPGTSEQLYTRGHDPAYMYKGNSSCATNDVRLTSDAQLRSLPAFTFIVPNQCGNMHTWPKTGQCPAYFGSVPGNNSVRVGDNWLAHVVPVLLEDPAVTVVVTFDEGTDSSAQRVYTVEVGAGITPGTVDGTRYDHYGFLAGVYEGLDLGPAPNGAAHATPLPIVPPRDDLNVTVGGDGSGAVTSIPSGISCGTGQTGTCASTYVRGTSVALTAAPAPDSLVGPWGGPCGSVVANLDGSSTCTVASIAQATAISASFVLAQESLTVTAPAGGVVTSEPAGIDCGATCSWAFANGQSVVLTATPDLPGWTVAWTGCDATTDTTCTVAMTSVRAVSATFAEPPPP